MRSANPELTLLKALFAVTSNGEGAQDGRSPAQRQTEVCLKTQFGGKGL